MRFRFLPLLILVAVLGTGVKLTDLWQSLGGPTPALAAGDPPPAEQGRPLQTDAGEAMAEEPATVEAPDGTAPAGPVPEGQITNLPTDVFQMTDEELVLLQSLSQRREELEQRARQIDEREVLLKAAERRIDQKISELERLQASIESLLVQHDEQSEAQVQSLVKIYESMKPKDAARIFEELDMEVLLEVIERMKERKIAPILAQMNPQRAQTVTLELAQRRDLPIPLQ
jgi:flagellar motility protein MotE (MotC chaperone)